MFILKATSFSNEVSLFKFPGIKQLFLTFYGTLFLTMLLCFTQCKKEHTPLNITLHDKPLGTIQSYIQGKWKLQYAYGGISVMKFPARHNSYMFFSPDHIIIGNDSTGIVVDTSIIWKR